MVIELSYFTGVFLVVRPFYGTKVKVKFKYQGHIFLKMAVTGHKCFTNTTCFFCFYRQQEVEKRSRHEKNDSTKSVKKILTCGKVANYTQYDHLRGIAARSEHPHVPEPEVAIMFRKKGAKSSEVDMTELEIRLRKVKKQV